MTKSSPGWSRIGAVFSIVVVVAGIVVVVAAIVVVVGSGIAVGLVFPGESSRGVEEVVVARSVEVPADDVVVEGGAVVAVVAVVAVDPGGEDVVEAGSIATDGLHEARITMKAVPVPPRRLIRVSLLV